MEQKLKQLFTLFLVGVLSFAGCSSKEKVSSDSNSTEHDGLVPDSELRGATIYLYEKEKVTTEVHAERLLKFEAKDSTMAYMLDIDFFDSTGHLTTELVADSGVIRESSNQLHVYGNVVVVTDDRSRLETEYLFWNTNTDKIQTDAYVKITKKDDVITGWGMETDPKLSRIKILNRVSGTVHEEESTE
jgi:LPS export ABC transporter protein LptC